MSTRNCPYVAWEVTSTNENSKTTHKLCKFFQWQGKKVWKKKKPNYHSIVCSLHKTIIWVIWKTLFPHWKWTRHWRDLGCVVSESMSSGCFIQWFLFHHFCRFEIGRSWCEKYCWIVEREYNASLHWSQRCVRNFGEYWAFLWRYILVQTGTSLEVNGVTLFAEALKTNTTLTCIVLGCELISFYDSLSINGHAVQYRHWIQWGWCCMSYWSIESEHDVESIAFEWRWVNCIRFSDWLILFLSITK